MTLLGWAKSHDSHGYSRLPDERLEEIYRWYCHISVLRPRELQTDTVDFLSLCRYLESVRPHLSDRMAGVPDFRRCTRAVARLLSETERRAAIRWYMTEYRP
jgi:hypothetical protein